MGKGILMGAIGGFGQGLNEYATAQQKTLDDQSRMQQQAGIESKLIKERADIDAEKQIFIEKMKSQMAREAGIKQGKDIQEEENRLRGEEEASVKSKYGDNGSSVPVSLIDMSNPENRKDLGLLNTRQSDLERRAKAASNLGYLEAARDARGELQIEITNQRQDAATKDANRRMDISEKFNENRAKFQERLASIQEARINRMESRGDIQMQKAELQSSRQALSSVLKDLGTQEDKIQSQLLSPMISEEQKTLFGKQLIMLESDRKQAREELMKLAGVTKDTSSSNAPYPDGTRLEKDGQAYVVKNGQAILESTQTKPVQENTARQSQQKNISPSEKQTDKNGTVDVSNDPVLSNLRKLLSDIDKTDVKNLDKIKAYGAARNIRIEQLQQKHGRLTELTGI